MMLWFLIVPICFLVYTWIIFPMLLAVLARVRRKRCSLESAEGSLQSTYRVAILVSAYNEEKVIAERARNLVESCRSVCGKHEVRILIGIDGATDRTAEIARRSLAGCSFADVVEFAERRGKIAVLKELAERELREEGDREGVLVFTDANTRFMPGAIEKLLSDICWPKVGGVSGRLIFRKKDIADSSSERIYWDLETKMKTWESAIDSCLGANGAIYAIRSELFWRAIPSDTIVEDFVIGMKVREQGWRMIYEPGAVAEEDLPPAIAEWRRRIRIGAGDFQALWLCRRCLHPRMGLFAWCFWSHKVLRWLTPHILLALLVGASACAARCELPARRTGVLVLAAFLIWCVLALAGALIERRFAGRSIRVLRIFWYAMMIQAAIFVGFLKYLLKKAHPDWIPTPR